MRGPDQKVIEKIDNLEASQKAVKVPGEDLANPLEAHATRAALK
jgi:hypothetical protein